MICKNRRLHYTYSTIVHKINYGTEIISNTKENECGTPEEYNMEILK